ncbi:MAG: FtsH protease activity modulator HflK [Gammaproteobacteria bacterium]|nr:FtsH protease activity modulator HflK [Gammaproteobacteria bacterium]|tara:strand:- start:641 stop:1759 length:1119 start_codon:yes stop_codon:yes gene_type:complete
MSNKDSGNGHDPWKRDPWKKGGNQPNDLDQIARKWQKRFDSIIGGGPLGGFALIIVLVIAWSLTGFYRVDEAERGVVQRFGAYSETSLPGLRWHYPYPVETVSIINIQEVNDYNFSTEMLTADEQYVFIDIVVQYRRTDPVLYSFEVANPEVTLQDVTESALRGVVGTSSLDLLIGNQREEIPERTIEELQETLSNYGAGTGLTVTSINLNVVDYPKSVQEAVDDTQKARNDRDRYVLEATTYANDLIPRARGAAQRVLQDAEAYKDRVIADSEGESSRFEALLIEYQKAPRVTRDRLYIDAVSDVYSRTNKVIIDSEGSGNLMYLPLDQLMRQSNNNSKDSDFSLEESNKLNSTDRESNDSMGSSRERRIR